MVKYASRTLSKSERNYPAYKLEFLALKWAITDQFHKYLYGEYFYVYTDNNPLTYILKSAKLDVVSQHWVTALAMYNFKLYYKTGKSNVEGEALSQIPWHKTKSGYSDLDPVTVKVIIAGCTTEIPLIEAYAGKAIIPFQEKTSKTEVDQNTLILNQNGKNNRTKDNTIAEIVKLLKDMKLGQWKICNEGSGDIKTMLRHKH